MPNRRRSRVTGGALLAVVAGSAAAPDDADGSAPRLWLAVSSGYFWGTSVTDGVNGATWMLEGGWPQHVGIERPVRDTTSVGTAGTEGPTTPQGPERISGPCAHSPPRLRR